MGQIIYVHWEPKVNYAICADNILNGQNDGMNYILVLTCQHIHLLLVRMWLPHLYRSLNKKQRQLLAEASKRLKVTTKNVSADGKVNVPRTQVWGMVRTIVINKICYEYCFF